MKQPRSADLSALASLILDAERSAEDRARAAAQLAEASPPASFLRAALVALDRGDRAAAAELAAVAARKLARQITRTEGIHR